MKKIDILSLKLETQIDAMCETLVSIQELEEDGPARHLSHEHKIKLSMLHHSMLMRHIWDKMNKGGLSTEQRLEIVTEIGNATHEHYLELYGFDTKKL